MKKIIAAIFACLLAINLCGCMAAMIWMAENATSKQTLNLSYSQAIDIVKATLIAEGIKFQEAVIKDKIAEVKGTYTDEKTMRIYIHKISDTQCDIAVRVGTSEAGKKDAEKILQAIIDHAKKGENNEK